MGLFTRLRARGEGGAVSPPDAAAVRRLVSGLGLWRGRGHTIGSLLLGSAAWILFAPGVAAAFLGVSVYRLLKLFVWLMRTPRPYDQRVWGVLVATSSSIAATVVTLKSVSDHLYLDARSLPLVVAGVTLALPFVWIPLNYVAATLSKRIGVPPLLGRFTREVVEESARGVVRPPRGRTWRFLNPAGDTGPNVMMAFLFWTGVGAGIASLGIPVFSAPHTLARFVVHEFGDGRPEASAHHGSGSEGANPGETDDARTPGIPGFDGTVPPTPSGQPTAFDICGFWPESVFEEDEDAPAEIAARLADVYYGVGGGAKEVGCPHDGVYVEDGLYLSVVREGESEQSLLIVADQEDAVVFDQLFRYARRLLRRDSLAWVEVKKSTGLGDYQIFHLANGSCVLANRNLYRQDRFVVLPAIVSHVVMQLTILRDEFPEVSQIDPAASIVARGRVRVRWTHASGLSSHKIVVSKRNADDILGEAGEEVVDIRECPDVEAFEAVAAQAKREVEAEAAQD